MMRSIPIALLAALLGCSCSREPTSAAPSSGTSEHARPRDQAEDIAGGIAWHVDEPLVARAPSSEARAAEYIVRDHPEAQLAVFHFGAGEGGSVDDNVHRWVEQFTQPDGRPSSEVAQITHRDASGMPITVVDVSGHYGGMGPSGAAADVGDQRMLGAIVEGPEGLVFFKLIGPADVVEIGRDAFERMLGTMHPLR
jgi:hypothetical protein